MNRQIQRRVPSPSFVRGSARIGIEPLERRDLMAADLMIDNLSERISIDALAFYGVSSAAVETIAFTGSRHDGIGTTGDPLLFPIDSLPNFEKVAFDKSATILDLPANIAGQSTALEVLDGAFGSLQKTSRLVLGSATLHDVFLVPDGSGSQVDGFVDVPGAGQVLVSGYVSADYSTYQLHAELPQRQIGAFKLTDVSVDITPSGMQLGGDFSHSWLGTVHFSGEVKDGGFEFKESIDSLKLLDGILDVREASLTMTLDKIGIIVDATIADLGDISLEGVITADGYSIGGSVDMQVAGFDVPKAGVTIGSDNAIEVEFGLTIPGLEEYGNFSFGGSYGPGGVWSITGTYPGPIQIGAVTLNGVTVTIANDYFSVKSIATIAGLEEFIDATPELKVYFDGRIHAEVPVDASIGGFSLGNAVVTLGNENPAKEYKSTIKGTVNYPGIVFELSGELQENGDYSLKGTGEVEVAGLKFSEASFELTKQAGLGFRGQTDILKTTVAFKGVIDKDGGYEFTADGNLSIAGLKFGDAKFWITNTSGLGFSAENKLHKVTGSVSDKGKLSYDLTIKTPFGNVDLGKLVNDVWKAASSLKNLSSARLAQMAEMLDEPSLKRLVDAVSDTSIAGMLQRLDASDAKRLMRQLGWDRLSNALEQVNVKTLDRAIDQLGESAHQVLNKINNDTLGKALTGMSWGSIAEQLAKVKPDTLRRAFEKLDSREAGHIINRLETNTLKTVAEVVSVKRLAAALNSVATKEATAKALAKYLGSRAGQVEKLANKASKAFKDGLNAADNAGKNIGGYVKARVPKVPSL